MTTTRIKLLQTKYELVIPEGINYGEIPSEYWVQLQIFERKIYPFMVVQSRMRSHNCIPSILKTEAARNTYLTLNEKNPEKEDYVPEIEMITVDTKTFHCTLGASFDLRLSAGMTNKSPEEWATAAAKELYDGYREQDRLVTKTDKPNYDPADRA